ncbi:hypothetical protein Tco_1285852 [Tanacetum coccineum]
MVSRSYRSLYYRLGRGVRGIISIKPTSQPERIPDEDAYDKVILKEDPVEFSPSVKVVCRGQWDLVLARERNGGVGKLEFTNDVSNMSSKFCDSLNNVFLSLIEFPYSDEDLAKAKRFRLEEAKRLRLEEAKMLDVAVGG